MGTDRQGSLFPLSVLLFRVGRGHYCASADQVASTAAYRPGDQDGALLWFHREMGCRAVPPPVAPVVASLRGGSGECRRMVIGDLEDLVEISADEVRLLPPTVAPYVLRKGLWGVLPRQGRLYMLVDLNRLARQCPGDASPPGASQGARE
ncbi:MAG: hypothetical protein ACLGSA_12785 [Acidobacteriota bacterium]